MSSFQRTLQRAVKREIFYLGRGSRLGVVNKFAKDLRARLTREERHAKPKM